MRRLGVFVLLFVFVFPFSSTLADHMSDERSADFYGSTTVEHELNEECADLLDEECPITIYSGLVSVVCDGYHPWGFPNGYGGVMFCWIPRSVPVELEFTQVIGAVDALGTITCPFTDDETTWYLEFGRLYQGQPTLLTVPSWCDDTGEDDHPDTTDVGVWVRAADTTQPSVHAQLRGEVALTILPEEGEP